MSLKIMKPGLLTTIQDGGRYGYQKDGIVVSGAMDTVALRVANLLVGNNEYEAALEITLLGPKVYFEENLLIAITGADLAPTIDGKPVKMWRPVYVQEGSLLEFGHAEVGCRAYIAVAGGFDIPKVMGSYSTYLRAALGGLNGRALQAGDMLQTRVQEATSKHHLPAFPLEDEAQTYVQATWTLDPQLYPTYETHPTIRVIKGPEYELFSERSKSYLWNEHFPIAPQSDRMGYRLQGIPLTLAEKVELISSAVTFGTVQVPPEGNPIILMADHQTTGGYPRMAQVITVDLPVLAQVPPGKTIRFQEVSLEEAQHLYIQQEQNIEQLKRALRIKKTNEYDSFS